METVFVGRKKELDSLERAYTSSGNRCCAIYGRRRVGKTELVKEFVKDKESLFLYATDSGLESNLEVFRSYLGLAGYDADGIEDLPGFFDRLASICEERRLVVVIDEYPDLVSCCPAASAITQRFIDLRLNGTGSFLIILGSSVSAMKFEVLDKDRPLFGRFGRVMELEPLSVRECRELLPPMSLQDSMDLYCIFGGVPAYYLAVTGSDFRECLMHDILAPNTLFSNEAQFIVMRELKPYDTYASVLDAIGSGCTTSALIEEHTGFDQSTCSKCLRRLMLVGFVEKDNPMFDTNRKTDHYRIADRFLDWHFSIEMRYGTLISSIGPDAAADRLRQEIRTFMGRGFEAACRDYVLHTYACRSIGRWWGTVDGEDVDIDIVAEVEENGANKALFAECRYRSKKALRGALDALRQRSAHVRTRETPIYIVFSRSGFASGLIEAEEDGEVLLVGLDRIYGEVPQAPASSSRRPSPRSRCGRGAYAPRRSPAPASASGPPGPATGGMRLSRACTCPGPPAVSLWRRVLS